MSICAHCFAPLCEDGESRAVVLVPCGHFAHQQCSTFIRKNAKLHATPWLCPTCGLGVRGVTPLFTGSSISTQTSDQPEQNDSDVMARLFHFQRRCLMHQRHIIESQIELRGIQNALASLHLEKERLGGEKPVLVVPADQAADSTLSGVVKSINATTAHIFELQAQLTSTQLRNEAKARACHNEKARARSLKAARPKVVPRNESHPKRNRGHTTAFTLQEYSRVLAPAPVQEPEPAPSQMVVDVDAVDLGDIGLREIDVDLVPFVPVKRKSNVPQMGQQFSRSIRDIPNDNLFQTTL